MSDKFECKTVDGDAFLLPRNKVGKHIIQKGDGSHSVQGNTGLSHISMRIWDP
jgi:hypothetical protein